MSTVTGYDMTKFSSRYLDWNRCLPRAQAGLLAGYLENVFGAKPKVLEKEDGVNLYLDDNLLDSLGDKGYQLSVSQNDISITASTTTGVFHGI